MELCVLFGLLRQHPINVAKVGFIGIGVCVTAAINVTVTIAFEGLVIPHIGLCSHKETARDIPLVVHDECHHPLEVLQLLGVEFTHTALRQRCLQDGIRIRACRRGIGVAVQEACGTPAIAIATIQAVEHFACRHRGLVAVRRTVMEKPRCPVVCVAGRLDPRSCAGSGQRGSREQHQQRHDNEERRDEPGS